MHRKRQHEMVVIYSYTNWKVYVVYNLSDCMKNEGVLKVTASHVHYKSGDISETVQDRDVVTTDH